MLGFLPWEKWFPPFILGPLLCIGPILALLYTSEFVWWEFILAPLTSLFGAWGTWVWFIHGENIFDTKDQSASKDATKADAEKNDS